MTRTDLPPSFDERATLTTFLDYARETAREKCAEVSADDARRSPLPGSPLMTLCGLISHLRWVEYFWIEVVFLGQQDEGPWTEEDPDREMTMAVDIPLADLLADYEAQSARYRELVAGADLDAPAVRTLRDGTTRPNLRWILFHLVEETARHNGHLDIVRELLDGRTGS
ncbi:putative damage-inducible protein DinB [Streptacidiphilus sp. MAP12-33]|uniref:DinB family protein n=1 Tax=Streptacidiphilus sp. MAP12-33 TaxID=3156266 RepID=UPI0035190AE6